jgi:hypothetical protein
MALGGLTSAALTSVPSPPQWAEPVDDLAMNPSFAFNIDSPSNYILSAQEDQNMPIHYSIPMAFQNSPL